MDGDEVVQDFVQAHTGLSMHFQCRVRFVLCITPVNESEDNVLFLHGSLLYATIGIVVKRSIRLMKVRRVFFVGSNRRL